MLPKKKSIFNLVREFNKDSVNELFAFNFSKMNLVGIDLLMDNTKTFDGITKKEYLGYIGKFLEQKKVKGITEFTYKPIICKNCKKGCAGFIFLDKSNKEYSTFILETENQKISDLKECSKFISENSIKGYKHNFIRDFPVF